MNLDDAAAAAIGSPTLTPPHPSAPSGSMSLDDAAGLAVNQTNAATASTIKNNLYNATAQSPDTAAANQNLARAANMPVESVAANPTAVKQQLAAQNTDATAMMQETPATANFLTNPQNAAIAHDDIANLTGIEKAMQPVSAARRIASAGLKAIKDVFDTTNNPIGFSPDDLALLGLNKKPDDIIEALRQVPAGTLALGADVGDLGMRLVSAPFAGGIEMLTQLGRELGMSDSGADRLNRDLNSLLNSEMGRAVGGHGGVIDNPITRAVPDVQKAQNAVNAAEQMTHIDQLATESKVRERDPQAFSDFMRKATENTAIKDVYIDGKQFAQTAGDQLPGLAQALPEVIEQLPSAIASGGDVRIPVADFAAKLAGSDLAKEMIPHLKTDPDGFSQIEAQEQLAALGEQMKTEMEKEQGIKTEDAKKQASVDAVQQQVMDQLVQANRFTPDVNQPYAQLVANFYKSMADRTGMTAEELYAKHPLNIQAENVVGGFDQAAYHGSPYRFDKFDLSKIGTGEGVQQYGHGIYFAEDKNIAGTYTKRDHALEEKLLETYKRAETRGDFATMEVAESAMLHKTPHELKEIYNAEDFGAAHVKAAKEISDLIQKQRKIGQLYEVNIPDEDAAKMLDWDKTLSEQTPAIQKAITPFIAQLKKSFPDFDAQNATGGAFYHAYADHRGGNAKTASDTLREVGIPGIKYLDGDSRMKGDGTRNFVIFDQAVLDKINGQVEKLYQGRLGAYHPASSTISLMKGANLSTFLHESGHFFLDSVVKIATGENAPEAVKADAKTLMEWLGVKDADTFSKMTIEQQRVAHEQFARTFEKYLLDGKAPSLEMQSVFSRFRSWLLNVYQSAQRFLQLHPEAGGISDEVRGVFDRMLATDADIQKAQAARGMTPLFATPKDAGMTEEEFKQYHEQNQQATSEAASELDARRLRDMQYASNARSEAIKDLQREAATKRAAIRAEVTKEVQAEPVYAAEKYLKTGETFGGEKALGDVKLSAGGLREIGIPDEMINSMKRQKLVSDEGIHPDAAAELFGFNSGQGLVEALASAEPMHEKIKGLTDQRMLERHGELTDPASIARAANAAIYNDVRAKVVATELNALSKQLGNKALLTKAAKEFAEKIVSELPANKINPNQYIAAAARASKAADKAFKAGDLKEAAVQKRNQLINQYAVKAAFEQQAAIQKGLSFLNKFGSKAFRDKIPGSYLEQIDGILAKYDLRKNPSTEPTRAEKNLATWVDSQREAGFEPYIADFIMRDTTPIHYGDLSVEQFKGLVDTVRSIKFMSDNLKQVTIAGQRMALDYAIGELLKPMLERGNKFTKEELLNPKQFKTDPMIPTALEKMASTLRLIDSDLKPIEFKRNEYDLHELQGPFGKYIFEPMFERNYWKVEQLRNVSREFGAMGERLGADWQKSLYNLVENKTLLDPDLSTPEEPVFLKMTRAKMLGIARHVGNESNFDKLTKGYNWKPADVWNFLHENMTEKDWQATQAQWDIFEKFWPEIEGLMRRLGGVPPEKIPLRPFDTKFGKMTGGYAPIDYDPIRSKLSNKWGDVMSNPDEAIGQEQAYRATTTFNGSTQNRSAGYTDVVNLDYHATEGRLRDTIHDLAYREALIDANKILSHPDFRSQFLKTFGREDYKGMQSWLRGIRDMNRNESQIKGFEKFLQYARTGVVMTGIAYRISTVLKHGSSAALKSFGYLGDASGAKYFAARAARMATGNASADIQGAVAKFPEIASRMNQMDRDYKIGMQSMYHAEDWRAKNDRFGHAMVAWSDMLTAVPTAWAAYDRATIEGIPVDVGGTGKPMSESEAISYANKIVREAHGTALEANRSLFLQARGVKGLFGTIYGFMNNTYGQMGDLMDKTVIGGHFQNKPQLVGRAMATIIAPALMAGWVSGTFSQNEPWWEAAAKSITGEIAGTVPFVRDAWQMIERGDTSSAGTTAPIRIVGDTVKAAIDAYKIAHGQSAKIIQDLSNAIGELFHIGGLGQAGKTAQYLEDVREGKQNPKNAKEFVTGATIGAPPKNK